MAKLAFATQFEYPAPIANPTGDKYDITRHMEKDAKGNDKLVIDGKHDRYAEIQKYLPECLIENIEARCQIDPEFKMQLESHKGMYTDATMMPKTLMEAQNTIIRLKGEFDKLPGDIRKKFDNNADAYIASYGTVEWGDKLGLIKEKTEETNKEGKGEETVNE